MYLRFVHLKIKPERVVAFGKWYQDTVLPVLQGMDGCIAANLIQSASEGREWISLSVWDSASKAQAYEQSEKYQAIRQGIREYLAESSEWRIHLTEDFTLVSEPVPEEPLIKAFDVMQAAGQVNDRASLHVRVVSPRINPGKRDEFVRLYEAEILPVLRRYEGCRYAALTTSAADPDQLISLTIWASKRDAEQYEQSGTFRDLVKKVRHTFSGMYQWKMQLERESGHPVFTTDDLQVEEYRVVTGKSFQS